MDLIRKIEERLSERLVRLDREEEEKRISRRIAHGSSLAYTQSHANTT
jgi:hypothetical protein